MLAIENLSCRYPGAERQALSGVTLQVERGEVFGLLGPNGAGKTTLIAHLAGLMPIQAGRISLEGEDLAAARQRDPTSIAIAPQEFAFYPMLSVRENLQCFAGAGRLVGQAQRQAIDRCLAFAQLEAYRDTRADHLSGGLKRRLNLAIALLPSPSLVLLDEPTVGVDPQSRAFLLDVVKQLASDGAAVIYTSHYMEEIEAIADRVAILDYGQVLRCAPLGDLLREGGGQRLELTVPPGQQAAVAELLHKFGTVDWQGLRATLDLPDGSSPLAVLGSLEAAGLAIEQASYGRSTLEHLFMRLTHRSLRDA